MQGFEKQTGCQKRVFASALLGTDYTPVGKLKGAPGAASRSRKAAPYKLANGMTRADFLKGAALTTGLLSVGYGVVPEEAEARERTRHPRVIADRTRFDQIKSRLSTNADLREDYKRLKHLAETEILPEPLVRYQRTGAGGQHKTARELLNRMFTLGFLYRLNPRYNKKFADRAIREMLNAAKYPSWRPHNALDLGELTTAMAVGYDWCFHRMNRTERERVRNAIFRLGIEDYMSTPNTNWKGNWNQVIHSGIGVGCMAIKGEVRNSRLVRRARRRVEKNLPTGLKRFWPDGGTEEGVGYWSYGWQYLTYFFQTTLIAEGTYSHLVNNKGLRRSGHFPMYCTGPTNELWQFADNGRPELTRGISALVMWHGRKYDKNTLRWFGNRGRVAGPEGSGKDHATSLLHHDSVGAPPKRLDLNFWRVGAATFRSSWKDSNALFVGFKWGGRAGGMHTHLDRGSFVITALGHQWSKDLGPESYAVPGYFDYEDRRWNYYRCRAEGHNTLVINPPGLTREDQKISEAPVLDKRSLNSASPFLVSDLTPVYRIRKVKRGIKLLDREKVIIQDEVRADKGAEVWWFMHSKANIELSRDRKSATLSHRDGKRLWLKIQSPSGGVFGVKDATPLPGSPDPAQQNGNRGVKKLAIRLDRVRSTRITVLAVPLNDGEPVPTSLPPVIPLAKW